MVLSTAYCPPVEFFALLAEDSTVYLEACEHFEKQSWRSRCSILTANGPQTLGVPVVHCPDLYHTVITEVDVDYSTPWVARTEYAIDSAYYSSPFFEYYRDGLFAILDGHPAKLWDLDLSLIAFFCSKIGVPPPCGVTSSYHGADYDIHPKRTNSILGDLGLGRPYWQVFGERFGFVPGLSVMDLLFNEGPESICYLK